MVSPDAYVLILIWTESINRLVRYDSEHPHHPSGKNQLGRRWLLNEVTVGRDGIGYRHITGTST